MEESQSRQGFNSKVGFIIAAVGSAVGLGNIWRFPYVLYENGGGSFLIPYFIAVFTAAIPLLILEYVIGSKFRGSSPLAFARNHKKLEWVGWLPTFISAMIILYYSTIISWAINYFFLSIKMSWGADTEAYFNSQFLQLSTDPLSFDHFNLMIWLGLMLTWGSTYFICSRSISSGIEKINKVLLPILGICLLFVVFRGVTLEGAVEGLNVLFTPDFALLLNPQIWLAAFSQVFFSLSVAMGIMITYASYLPKKSDIVNTAYITGLANSAVEFTIAIGVFGILGYMAAENNVAVNEVVSQGVGLAFVVFPKAFNLMGGFGTYLATAFFASLVFAGFTSFISLTEAFVAPFSDKFKWPREKVYRYICLAGFLVSSVYATGAGLYILDIVDFFINSFAIVTVGIIEAVVVAYVLKLERFKDMANEVSIQKVGQPWIYSIKFIVPIFLTINLAFLVYTLFKEGYGGYKLEALLLYGAGTLLILCVATVVMTKVKWKNPQDLEYDLSKGE
ncbi:MAG: sodium-dependent transporter [Lactovum sp.]